MFPIEHTQALKTGTCNPDPSCGQYGGTGSRLESLCRSIEHWELDCSHTDVGDPWCVIYDRHEHRIILHIARIDRRYVVVWPPRQRSMNIATMEVAVDMALAELVSMT